MTDFKSHFTGVGSGLTFSAPVWPTTPQVPVQRITPQFPNHQASSFFYEDKKNLPPIAYYRLHKIKEYVGVKEKSAKRIHQKYRRWSNEMNVDVIINFYFLSLRHDDHRVRHPTSRKTNRIKTEEIAKRSREEISRSANEIVDYESPDCVVSEWEPWSNCSKSCGLGEKFRIRTITKTSKKGGLPCPQLSERSWCGSSRCKPSLANENIGNSSYFMWR